MKQAFSFFLSAIVFFATGCTDPITVGSDLLSDDRAVLGQTMELDFTTTVVREDSILTYANSNNAARTLFSFGQLDNEAFGEVKHSVYLIPRLSTNTSTGFVIQPPFALDDDVDVDSVVLILPIDTTGMRFGSGTTFPIRMLPLTGQLDVNRDYYSTIDLPTGSNQLQRAPNLETAATARFLFDTAAYPADTSIRYPHIRIAFNDQFVRDLNALPASAFENDTTLADFFSGVLIEPTDDGGSLVSLRPLLTLGGQALAGMYYHYPDTADQTPTVYRAPLAQWLPRYEQDFGGTLFGDRLADGPDNENFVLAGQGGLMTAITFTDLSALENVAINEAQLTFFRDDAQDLDYDDFPAPVTVALYYRADDGSLLNIEDRRAVNNNTSVSTFNQLLGGNPVEDDDGNVSYQPRFSVHLQRMIEGEVPPTIYIRVASVVFTNQNSRRQLSLLVDRDPARVVLHGPQSPTLPASVRVVFTQLD